MLHAQPNPNPVRNLMSSFFTLLSNNALTEKISPNNNLIRAFDDMVMQDKDEHGNILIGLDNAKFSLWRNRLEHFVPTGLFSPFFIATNPLVIGKILSQLKTGAEADFKGNRSTEVVHTLVGTANIFAAEDKESHTAHRGVFKESITNKENNVRDVAPIVKNWLHTHTQMSRQISDKDLETLSAQIMLRFLLNNAATLDEGLISAVVNLKSHFVDVATAKKINAMGYVTGYGDAKKLLTAKIQRLYYAHADSYPKTLANKGFALQDAVSHILTLMMVGFDNLQSSLMSLLIRLTQNPDSKDLLKGEIIKIDETDFLDFDLSTFTAATQTFSQQFYSESLRLTPPVWLQARKNKNSDQTITYTNEAGQEKSFIIPSATLVFIPNFQLAREMKAGGEFKPGRELGNRRIFNPFSVGPNACPGRNIAYAAAGVLLADLVKMENRLTLTTDPALKQQVSLKWKNVNINIAHTTGFFSLQKKNENNTILKEAGLLGLVVTLAVYYDTQDMLKSACAGVLAALLMTWYLSYATKNDPAVAPQLRRS